jgi:hypothetical protein
MYRFKVIILFIFSIVFSVGVYSQNTYRKYYDNSVLNGNACLEIAQTAVVINDNLTIGVVRNNFINIEDTLNYSKVQLDLLLIDTNGNFIDTFYLYRKGFHLRSWDIFKKDSDKVLVFCSALDLVKYKNQNIGDFISIAELNFKTKQVTYHDIDLGLGDELIVKTLRDPNGYTILSQICNQAITNCDVSILRIDTNYAIQWHKIYTYNSNTFENPRDITELNGDYYFTTTSAQSGGGEFSSVHKLKNNGDSLSTILISNAGYDRTRLFSIIQHNNNIYCNGYVDNLINEFPFVLVLDENLIVKQRMIDKTLLFNINTNEINIKYNFIYLSGTTGDYTNPREARHSFSKYDLNFNKLWTRIYNDSLLTNRGEIIYDVLPLSNNDWMFLGFGTDPNSAIKNQDAVFVRVDSNGCLYNTCLNVGINEEIYFDEIIVYPNPAKDILNIEFPKHVNIHNIKLFDMLGREVSFESISNDQISIERLEIGVYTLQIMLENDLIVNKKIIKE